MKFLGIAATISILCAQNTHAYLDPSVMTYAIQAVAGVVIAIGAGIGIYFQKAKSKINKTLNVNENKKKEQEADVVMFDNNQT